MVARKRQLPRRPPPPRRAPTDDPTAESATAPPRQPRTPLTAASIIGMQRVAGNRAAALALADRTIADRRRAPTVQRDDLGQGGSGYKSGASEQVEFKLGFSDPKNRVKISGKVTASRRGSKYLESPTGQIGPVDAKWSLGENKASLERAGGRTAQKLASALARADFSSPKLFNFPGLRVRMSLKALEGKFDGATKEADLDLLKITGAVDGDLAEMLDEAGLAHLKDRVSCKVSLEAEVALSVMDLTRLKAAWRAKEEVKAAAEAAAKHGEDFAKQADRLKKLDVEHKQLSRDLDIKKKALGRRQAALDLERAKKAPTSKKAAGALRTRIARLEREQVKAAKALLAVEDKIAGNRTLVKSTAQAARSSRAGLAAAGEKLMKAGRKLDSALQGVTGKLGQFGKKALEKTTKRIMARLGKTLLAKGLAKLIPGLNIVSTIYDVGSLLHGLLSGKTFGISLDDGDGDGSGSADGTGGTGGTGGGGGGTGTGTGQGTGPGTTDPAKTAAGSGSSAPSKVKLTPTAKTLAEAYAGTSTVLDEDAAAAVNEGLPADITAKEMTELISRIKAKHVGGAVDPYELLAQIAAELADIRAGGSKATIDGKDVPTAAEGAAEPPKSLLPGTRDDVQQILVYDDVTGEMVVDPKRRTAINDQVFDHPDGLKVKLSAVDVTSRRPGGAGDNLTVTVSITIQVVALPASAGTSYPYKVGQTETEKMTFLHNPKRDIWGEMDYSTAHKLIKTVHRGGSGWELTGPNQVVQFEHATVRVTGLKFWERLPPGKGGTVHRFILEVVPTEITAKEAGYMNPNGWVTFTLKKPAKIAFSFTESAPVAVP